MRKHHVCDLVKPTNRFLQAGMLAGLLTLAAPWPAFAGLKIDLVFIGGRPPIGDDLVRGGGNIQEIVQVAAEAWEKVFKNGSGKWNLTLYYGWESIASSLFGQEVVIEEGGGNINRITRARFFFNSAPTLVDGNLGYFADPTPRENSEYLLYTPYEVDVEGGGQLNIGRVFSEATGDAVNRIDLLTIAMHEIGHALGMDGDYSGFQTQFKDGLYVELTSPRPFAGLQIIISNGPHIAPYGSTPLMVGIGNGPTIGWRQFISDVDALLIAQLSSFDRPSLDDPFIKTKK